MSPLNSFFAWFFFGLDGLGGWFFFVLIALVAIVWLLYDSSKHGFPALGWRFGIILTAMLILPAIIFRFTVNSFNSNSSPLTPFIEPIFYLGLLGGVMPIVLAIGYFITYRGGGVDIPKSGIRTEVKEFSKSGKSIKVFLCHAKEDKPAVRQLYQKLLEKGFYVWLDEENLLPGQDWKHEIPKAVRNSDIVIICLSRKSIDKAGFVQKEIKYALDIADEKPEGQIFLIPARLEECEVPERLNEKHWVDLFAEQGFDRLLAAIYTRRKR